MEKCISFCGKCTRLYYVMWCDSQMFKIIEYKTLYVKAVYNIPLYTFNMHSWWEHDEKNHFKPTCATFVFGFRKFFNFHCCCSFSNCIYIESIGDKRVGHNKLRKIFRQRYCCCFFGEKKTQLLWLLLCVVYSVFLCIAVFRVVIWHAFDTYV